MVVFAMILPILLPSIERQIMHILQNYNGQSDSCTSIFFTFTISGTLYFSIIVKALASLSGIKEIGDR